MDDTFIGILFCCTTIFFFGGIFGCFAYLRYLRHKEIIALAEKGLAYPRYQGNGKGALRWGIAITGLGVALGIGLYPIGWWRRPVYSRSTLGHGCWQAWYRPFRPGADRHLSGYSWGKARARAEDIGHRALIRNR